MRREIGDQQSAAGRHHPRRFRHRGAGIVQIMQHLVEQHDIETRLAAAIGKGQAIGVAQPHLGMADILAQQPVAGDGEHVRAHIDAHGAPGAGGQQFQHPAGAGAGIQQIFDLAAGQLLQDRRFDVLVGRMQGADALPLRGIGLEIGRRGGGAGLAHMGEPGAVGVQGGGIGQARQHGAKLRPRAAVGGAIEHPASFLETLQQSRLPQQFEVPRHPGLALADDFDQLAHRQLRLAQQQQQPQPGGIPGGAQHGHQLFH